MRAPVGGEDLVVEVFNAEAESRDSNLFHRLQLCLLNRTGLTFERYFFRVVPTHVTIETIDEISQLLLTDVRGCPSAEIRKAKLAALKRGHAAVELVLFDQRVEVDLDLGSVFDYAATTEIDPLSLHDALPNR